MESTETFRLSIFSTENYVYIYTYGNGLAYRNLYGFSKKLTFPLFLALRDRLFNYVLIRKPSG